MLSEIVWNEGTISIVGGLAVVLAAILGGFWYGLEKAKSTNDLKREMVARGMSAEEIERVIAAKEPEEED